MSFPEVTVLIITFDRPKEIRLVIEALMQHLRYSGRLSWHLADDGSPRGYVDDIRRDFPQLHFGATVTKREGWGSNVNTGLAACKTDYVFSCEDDYQARFPLYLDEGVALLKAREDIGLVRYDGLSGHRLELSLEETETEMGMLDFLRIHFDSPCLNVYSHRPHLKHRRFHEHFGPYREKCALATSEVSFAHTVKDTEGLFLVALANGVVRAFNHIGVSRQDTELDPWK